MNVRNTIILLILLTVLYGCTPKDEDDECPVTLIPTYNQMILPSSEPKNFIEMGGTLYFEASQRLWAYDGSSDPHVALQNIPLLCMGTVYQGKLYFSGYTYHRGYEPVAYDGVHSPAILADIRPGSWSSWPEYYVVLNDRLFFVAAQDYQGYDIWMYDGVNQPVLFHEASTSVRGKIVVFNDSLIFLVEHQDVGLELWKTNGIDPAVLVSTITPNTYAYIDGILSNAIFNDKLYFVLDDGIHGDEIWVYDNVNQPYLLADLCAGRCDSNPDNLTVFNDKLYFTSSTYISQGKSNYKMYIYDGLNTPAVTNKLGEQDLSSPSNFIVSNNILYYTDRNGSGTTSMFEYSGSDDPIEHQLLIPGFENPRYQKVFGSKICFQCNHSTYYDIGYPELLEMQIRNGLPIQNEEGQYVDLELCVFDTDNNTGLLYDLMPGYNNSVFFYPYTPCF